MKKLIIILISISVFYNSKSFSQQWQEINTGLTYTSDMCVLDDLNWFLATGKSIYITEDGGENWTRIVTGLSEAKKIAAYNHDTIFIVNNNLYVTKDGGLNWVKVPMQEQTSGPDQKIIKMTTIGSKLYCLYSGQIFHCQDGSMGITYDNSHYLYNTKNFGETWTKTNELFSENLKLARLKRTKGYAYGTIYNIGNECELISDYRIYNINGSIKTKSENIKSPGDRLIAGTRMQNGIKHLLLEKNNVTRLYTDDFTGSSNELFNEGVTDIVFYEYEKGFLIKGKEVYRTFDIGENWYHDMTTPSNVSKSIILENGNLLLLCSTGKIYFLDIKQEMEEFSISANPKRVNFYDVPLNTWFTLQDDLELRNTGLSPASWNITIPEPFYTINQDSNDTLNQITVETLSSQKLSLPVLFKPTETIDYSDSIIITISEEPEFRFSIPITGIGSNFNGIFMNDTLLCRDTIAVNIPWYIPEGVTVDICAGTDVIFTHSNQLTIDGNLNANGTTENKINFHKMFSNNNKTISNSNSNIVLQNCNINDYASEAMDLSYNLLIDNCNINGGITSNGEFISISNSNLWFLQMPSEEKSYSSVNKTVIDNCNVNGEIHIIGNKILISNSDIKGIILDSANQISITSSNIHDGEYGIYIKNSDSVTVLNNHIFNSQKYHGLHVDNSKGIIDGNYIYNNLSNWYDYHKGAGIRSHFSNFKITNNFVFNNRGSSVSGLAIYGDAQIINNTICSNKQIGIRWTSGTGVLYNNIIYNNSMEIFSNDIDIAHNLFPVEFSGESNIVDDPLFRNPSIDVGFVENPDVLDWRISSDSPCLDAGNNEMVVNMPFDFYGNTRIMDGNRDGSAIVDIGAYEMDGELFGLNEIEIKMAQIYPNPSSGQIQISLNENKTQPLELKIYEISGSLVWEGIISDKQSSINLESLKAGVYLLKLIEEDHSQREILILQ